ncbi:hypothetical protein HYT23_03315 [Candidatus Pacearchaeota archaeon]|nr:hypothetical protein [Candidatus Pacearchaeota archaeon]
MIDKTNYREHTDKYFLRSRQILEAEEINPLVRYQVFARKDIFSLKGIDEAVAFIRNIAGDRVKIYSLKNGDYYKSGEPIMKLEGRVQDLIELETGYLSIISGALTGPIDLDEVRKAARDIRQAAKNKKIFYMGARHFSPSLDEKISRICYEEGFDGASTDVGAKAWNAEGMGTIPHALILSYAAHMRERGIRGNPTLEATKGFDKHIDKNVPRIALIDTFNEEIYDSMGTASAVPSLKGVRVDTCGENYMQDTAPIKDSTAPVDEDLIKIRDRLRNHFIGMGVKIHGVWALRKELDWYPKWYGHLEITVSSGFNAEKTQAFMEADAVYQQKYGKPLFNSIGTGSIANPIMTTSDIVAYYSDKQNKWVPLSKKGRDEKPSIRLEERR